MIGEYQTIYCMSWELRQLKRNLRKDNWEIVSIERVTRHKTVVVAKSILKNGNTNAK